MRRNYHSDGSFVDLLFNVLVGFVALFFIALMMINPVVVKKNNIEMKAEFIIKVTWPEKAKDDVDTYLEDPVGNLLFFNSRDVGLMHLDRDDLGRINDSVILPNGDKIVLNENREIATIRGIVKGEYVLNVHMFSRNDVYAAATQDENGNEIENEEDKTFKSFEPLEVTIEILKLNPYEIISVKKVILVDDGDEVTVLRFTLDENGKVVDMNSLEKTLVKETNQNQEGGN
jgi:hypothetical protein